MTDFTKLQQSSKASSNKVLLQGSGQFSVANLPGAGEVFGIATIPHGYGSDRLIMQVAATNDIAGTTKPTTLPWESNDGRVIMYSYVDSTNLYIVRINNDSGGFGFPATTVSYTYRLLIP